MSTSFCLLVLLHWRKAKWGQILSLALAKSVGVRPSESAVAGDAPERQSPNYRHGPLVEGTDAQWVEILRNLRPHSMDQKPLPHELWS